MTNPEIVSFTWWCLFLLLFLVLTLYYRAKEREAGEVAVGGYYGAPEVRLVCANPHFEEYEVSERDRIKFKVYKTVSGIITAICILRVIFSILILFL